MFDWTFDRAIYGQTDADELLRRIKSELLQLLSDALPDWTVWLIEWAAWVLFGPAASVWNNLGGAGMPNPVRFLAACATFVVTAIVYGWVVRLVRYFVPVISRRAIRRSPFGRTTWASLWTVWRAGMLKPGGLFLGQWRGLLGLLRFDLFHHGEGHFLTIASTGSGKSSGLVVPNLLSEQAGAFVVTDPSGELIAMTRRYRETLGPVVILNPFAGDFTAKEGWANVLDDTGFNPLTLIRDGTHLTADCANVARLLMVTINMDRGDYFDIDSVQLLTLLLVDMMLNRDAGDRHLGTLFDFVHREPAAIEKSLVAMAKANDSRIAPRARKFLGIRDDAPEQWAGVIARVQQAASTYEPGTPLGGHVARRGFDAADLKRKNIAVFLICPSQHLRTAQPWLNLILGTLGMAVGRPGPSRPVTFLVDEAPALGLLPDLRDTMGQYRKAGLRVWLFSQTRAAFNTIYGRDGADALLGLANTRQFFGIREWDVALDVSAMMGETSRENISTNDAGQRDREGISVVGVPLIRPEEISRMKRGRCVIDTDRVTRPIQARLVPYFTRAQWKERADPNPYRRKEGDV